MENNNKKFSLLIDGCLDYLELAIIKDNKVIDSLFVIQNKNLTKILDIYIAKIISDNNLDKKNIESIYVINGPGSFTSVKSVVIFANTFKRIFNYVNLYYLNSCQWTITRKNEISLIDAKSNLFYISHSNLNKPYLMKESEIEKISFSISKYFYSLENKKNLKDKWNWNKDRFIECEFIRPIYVKKPVYDYNKK